MVTPDDSEDEIVRTPDPHHADLAYRSAGSIGDQLAALAALHVADKAGERKRKRFNGLGGAVGILSVVIGLVGVIREPPAYYWGIWLLGPVAVVVLLALASRAGKQDIDDRKLDAARRPLEVLAPELKPGRPVRVKIDFRSYEKTKPVSGKFGAFTKSPEVAYRVRDWLTLEFTLLDGTHVRVAASTMVKRKVKTKRKYVKIKDKVSEALVVQMKAPGNRTLNAGVADQLRERFSRKDGMHLVACKMKPRQADLRFSILAAQRLRGRYGWEGTALHRLLDGEKVTDAIIFAYNATAVAAQPQAA